MTKVYEDLILKFPFPFEYTIDDGANWISVAADTQVTIDEANMNAERKVTVRSNDAGATTFVPDDLQLKTKFFEEINIRNGRLLDNMSEMFQDSIVERLYVQNIQSATLMTNFCSRGVFQEVSIDISESPNLESIESMFNTATCGAVGDLIQYPDSATTLGIINLYNNGNFGYIGELHTNRAYSNSINAYASSYYFMYNVTASVCSHATLKAKQSVEYQLNSLLKDFNGDCPPSIAIDESTGNTVSNGFVYTFAGATISSSTNLQYFPNISFITNTVRAGDNPFRYFPAPIKDGTARGFGSFQVKAIDEISMRDSSGYSVYYKNLVDIVSLFSTKSITDNTLLSYFDGDAYHGVNKPLFYSEKKSPTVAALRPYQQDSLIGTIGLSSYELQYLGIKTDGTDVLKIGGPFDYRTIKIAGLDNYKFGEKNDSVIKYGVTFALVAKNGYLFYQDGADVKVLDKFGVLLYTLAGETLTNASTVSPNGSKLYIVSGGSIDKSGAAGQNIVNTLKIIDVNTGSAVGPMPITLDADEWVAGVYQADDNYGIKVIKNKWHDNGGIYEFESVKIDSYGTNSLNILQDSETGVIDMEVSYIGFHHGEDWEFFCVNNVSGRAWRCYGE